MNWGSSKFKILLSVRLCKEDDAINCRSRELLSSSVSEDFLLGFFLKFYTFTFKSVNVKCEIMFVEGMIFK